MATLQVVQIGALFAAGVIAGLCNAIAGGGTFFSFPVFIAMGLPPVIANASNQVAVLPGTFFAAYGYRREFTQHARTIRVSAIIAFLGGISGAIALVYIDNHAFTRLIPFLLLFATLIFTFGQHLSAWLIRKNYRSDWSNPNLFARVIEYFIGVYGGFFGAGVGIMLMAGLMMMGVTDLQLNNALKNLLASMITLVSALVLAFSGLIEWSYTGIVFVGAMVGGGVGARMAQRIPALWLRRIVMSVGFLLSLVYFKKYYF